MHADESAAARQLRYATREDREDLVKDETRNLPAWSNGDAYRYFAAAERYDKKENVPYTKQCIAFEEWKITLPQELSREQNLVLIDDLLDAITGDRLPCTYAFHDPLTVDGTSHQPHIHLIVSARQTDGIARTPEQHFRRYRREYPERGGAQKDPAFWHKGAVEAHRVLIADVINLHLEANGQVARIHPGTLRERGIDREPEPKLYPSESAALKEKGEVIGAMQSVLDTRAQRNRIKEQNQARTYWEERKAELGLLRSQALTEQRQIVTQARQVRIHAAPARTPEQAHQAEQRAIKHAIAREHTQTGRPLQGPRQRQRQTSAQTLAQQLAALTAQLGHDEAGGRGRLRVKLHDEEREREHHQGMGW